MAEDKAADKAALMALKKQVVASDSILKDFNWVLNLPLDQSQVIKSGSAVLNHEMAREVTTLQRDVKAPFCELTFDTQRDDQARLNSNDTESHKISFNKVQLQQFFEELEKVQIKLDELS